MKTIIQAMLEEIYEKSRLEAIENRQMVGEKMAYFITLEQLEEILKSFED